MLVRVLGVLAIILCLPLVRGDPKYTKGSAVPMWSNKIGPFNNPSEAYSFHQFKPAEVELKSQDLGEMLNGDTKAAYPLLHFPFAVTFSSAPVCTLHLVREDVERLKALIENRYYYEFVYGYTKKESSTSTQETEYYLYTHSQYTFYANMEEGEIIFGNITFNAEGAILLSPRNDPMIIPVTYSAQWLRVPISYRDRYSVWSSPLSPYKAPMELHWYSIMNSIALVVILAAIVAFILFRVLKKDFQKYNDPENPDFGEEDEYGWKMISGDVFRIPGHINILSAIVGVGVQFMVVGGSIMFITTTGIYNPTDDGQLMVAAIVLYTITSAVAGFVSSYWYKKLGGENWVRNVLLTASLFSLPFIAIVAGINMLAVSHNTTHALPINAILSVLAMWALIGLPLTLLGAVAGKRFSSPFTPPVKPKRVKSELPALPWYRRLPITMAVAGFIPFSAIFTELHYIFASLWGHSTYHLWSILLIVFILLLLVTALTSICLVYLQLSALDWQWWWPSLLWGSSTGFWMICYSVYYFTVRSEMNGVIQTAFYFGYQIAISYAFFLSLGALGFLSSIAFVKKIYKNLHMD